MEFGKPHDPAGISVPALPAEPISNEALLLAVSADQARGPCRLRVGLSAWGDPDNVGPIYPAGTPRARFLTEYAQRFATVELNSTHYAIPSVEQLARWRDSVGEGFQFAPKFPKQITHIEGLADAGARTVEFLDRIRTLGSTLGPCFLQLPPSFGPSQSWVLLHYLGELPDGLSIAVELRHPGWFNAEPESGVRLLYEFLTSRGWPLVTTDTVGRREVVHTRLTSDTVFLRFVGIGRPDIDVPRMQSWADLLGRWASGGLRAAYVFVHQEDPNHALECAEVVESVFDHSASIPPSGDSHRQGAQLELDF